MSYKIADVNSQEFEAIKKAEALMKSETNKDFVLIAWEKKNKI